MEIQITVRRSSDYIRRKRIDEGVNTPEDIVVSVDPLNLSLNARRLLIDYYDKYSNVALIFHSINYEIGRDFRSGYKLLRIDSDSPTTHQLSDAIEKAFAEISEARSELLRTQQEKAAEAARVAEEKAAEARKISEARKLLKNEIDKLTTQRDRAVSDCSILSKFLASMPLHALETAIRESLQDDAEIAARKKTIEDACHVWVFSNRDDDDNDDNDDNE